MIVWNGNVFQGTPLFAELLKRLPNSDHNLNTFDVQPILSGLYSFDLASCPLVSGQIEGILISTGGVVSFAGEESPRLFSQKFILDDQTKKGTYLILNDCFRFV